MSLKWAPRVATSPSLEGRGKGRDSNASMVLELPPSPPRQSLPRPLPSREAGFTLMEIVLAIALASVVMYLLTTAIELFLIRVDSSRSQVESAQLARTILDRIAADLNATRLVSPPAKAESSSDSSSDSQGAGSPGGGDTPPASGVTGGDDSASQELTSADIQGLYGTVEQLRVDRTSFANWQRAVRQVEPLEPSAAADMPTSLRYYLIEGDAATSQSMAERGVSEEQTAAVRGLYRESIPTAALREQPSALEGDQPTEDVRIELLAPEVVKLAFSYYDGEQYVDAWDPFEEGALPYGVEIRLTLYEPKFNPEPDADEQDRLAAGRYRENELVEYRRFVRIPAINPPQPADPLLIQPEQDEEGEGDDNNNQGAGAPSGQDQQGRPGGTQ